MSAGGAARLEVRVDETLLSEDLARCTQAARAAIEPVIAELREAGVLLKWLRRCEVEGRDGTRLGAASSSMSRSRRVAGALVLAADEEAARPALVLLAVGERHPDRPWRPSVYECLVRGLLLLQAGEPGRREPAWYREPPAGVSEKRRVGRGVLGA